MASRLRLVALLALVVSLAGLTACSSTNGPENHVTLEEAKQSALATELEIAGLVPAANTVSVDQRKTSSTLFECTGGYTWPGRTTVELTGEVDTTALADSIAAHWKAKDGWAAGIDKTEAGLPRVDIQGPGGAEYLVSVQNGGTELRISSRSECFELPGGKKPGENY